jgi:uncharacterized protein YgiM (DUF1202 family)
MARKTFALTLAVFMLTAVISAIPSLATSVSIKTYVTTTRPNDYMYIRKGPHKGNTPKLEVVANKQAITLIVINDEDDGEAWSKVQVDATGTVGYMRNKYILYFGLDNSMGELHQNEDTDIDYTNAPDNDGYKGTKQNTVKEPQKIDPPVTPVTTKSAVGIITTQSGGYVNVRKSADTTSEVLTKVLSGTSVTITGVSGRWYQVKVNGHTGFIYNSYLTEGTTSAKTTVNVNLRKGPGTEYVIITTLLSGTSVTVVSKSGNWSYVKIGDTYGYVHNNYLIKQK